VLFELIKTRSEELIKISLACIASVSILGFSTHFRHFLPLGHIKIGEREKRIIGRRGVGRKRKRLPANPRTLKNTPWAFTVE